MTKQDKIIILGTAHLATTPGKQSPDGRFCEYAYSRKVANEVADALRKQGYIVFIDYMAANPNAQMKGATWQQEQSRELAWRVNFVNTLCKKYGKTNCIYVSMHTDAAGADGKWHDACGFSVRVSPMASDSSKRLARCLYEAAERGGKAVTGNRATPPAKYWTQSLYVLNKTACPAVLTESLFQDNKKDVDFLLSDKGREAIVRLHTEGIKNYVAKYGK